MAGVRDSTEDLKDTVLSVALSLEYDESKIASILASFIICKPRQKSPFTKAALKTLGNIEALAKFIVKHRKDYVERHRTTEQERDSIEHEIKDEDKNRTSRPWLGIMVDNSQADIVSHRHGVVCRHFMLLPLTRPFDHFDSLHSRVCCFDEVQVLILSERLHGVTAQFDQLRVIRFQEAVNRATPRRKPQKVSISHSTDASKSVHVEVKEPDVFPPEPLWVQQQLLDDETQALQVELSNLLDPVQETEMKMVEMSALNHLMSTHVLQQAQQIEFLYEQALEATNNVDMGNKELTQAIDHNSSSRTFLLLFFFVLTFSVVFLDQYKS
ncbi:hypothetical protein MKW92_029873 [Papaver armeniacum]|nr:hypothetical protein MKW92_029873 [Papaver armeniacum]